VAKQGAKQSQVFSPDMTNSGATRRFTGDFLPVAAREAGVAARKIFSYDIRSIIAALFAIVAFRRLFAPNWITAGPSLLEALGLMGYVYAIVAGAFKTFDALSREKREGTLGLLLLTDLKPFQILFGKLLSASALTVFGLLAFLPLLSMPMLVGGVVFDQIVRLAVSLVIAILLSMSWGLYISAAARNYLTSLAGAVSLVILFAFLPLDLATHLNPSLDTFSFETAICLFTPTLPFKLAFTVDPDLTQFFWPSIFCNLVLAAAWISAAVIILPDRCHEAPVRSKFIQTIRQTFHDLRFGSPARRAKSRRRLLETNPLLWLSNRDRVNSLALTALCAAILFLGEFFHVAQLALFLASLAILFRMAHAASHSISEDQKNGALELLLSTNLSVAEILNGLNRAMLRRFTAPVTLVICWSWFFVVPRTDFFMAVFVICSSVLLIATWIALSWVGLWFALRRKPTAAAWIALAVVVLPPWIIWVVSIFPHLFNPLYSDLQPMAAIVCCFVGLFHCILVTIWGRNILAANFREAAADPFATIDFEPTLKALVGHAAVTVVSIGDGKVLVRRWGSYARLIAMPGENQMFVGWGGHTRGSENPLELELQGHAYIVAHFTKAPPPRAR
jgi:ABC-type transport system involved in multi-copper enzyme maturation permease subunit